ncbi:dUTP diphosphatase [Priestia flexa]|jgi:dimeric dUTPase (all-alpha-NTP-PPase superfamily)|uniref:dUTP diphosphatase n=1 Tax=Priestia flexa TaxID=86664 RepID=A0A8I1MCZ8_9BACI|nr:dUTP diphosphatase [Priestia flexa]MBN8250647.1 dUTP diphosphatase [Priestia flexa]MBN8432531.1 dUTP diphosphatase [Priestia flexa]MCA0965484.1 dUTP diphosphatase [Priestia flexa]RIV10809.1 dUTPase [Priestia flexa]UIR29538.1 dUTP diphosphatase [Priestia flexa]
MNLQSLFNMQRQLDQHIETNHNLQNEDLVSRKLLALLVELGELANETRCFKFWSLKPSADKKVILEEFVDGVHFLLSLGIEWGFDSIEELPVKADKETATEQFLHVFSLLTQLKGSVDQEQYIEAFSSYMGLGEILGFAAEEVKTAYIMKNEVNFKRQDEGY